MYLVIFDCDGTLVDSQHGIVAAMNRAFSSAGLEPPDREATLSIVGLSLPQAFTVLTMDLDDPPLQELIDSYRMAFHEIRRDPAHFEPLYPGALDALDHLADREDVLLGMATGKSRRGVDAVLESHALAGRFVTIQTAEDAPSKPDPTMIHQAVSETGVDAGSTVIVGDTTFDMAMANNAGALAIGVSWGYHPPEALSDAGARDVVTDYANLIPALDAIWSGKG